MTSRKRRTRRAGDGDRRSVDRSLRAHLFDDENVIMVARPGRLATFPKFVATLGLYAIWRRRDTSVITDRRILVGQGIFRRHERSIPLDHVDDVRFARRGISSYADIIIDGSGRGVVKRVGPMAPRAGHRFAREILRQL